MLVRTRPANGIRVARDSVARIALLGLKLESNVFAPVTTRADFESILLVEGDAMLAHPFGRESLGPEAVRGFGARIQALRRWEPVPIVLASAGAGGACDHAFFKWFIEEATSRLRAAGEIHGVYIMAHGAGTTTEFDDMDGPYFQAVREIVGPRVPIVATLDLHGNISEEMVRAVDVQVSMVTNPHVDMAERAEEAAGLMDAMLDGMCPSVAFLRLPMVVPQVTQLVRPGAPYGDLLAYGHGKLDEQVLNVSILSGFAFSDSRHNGMAIMVATRDDPSRAAAVAQEIAEFAWSERLRYVPRLTTLANAVAKAVAVSRDRSAGQIVLADVADNPGGGGRGNTTWVLAALLEAGATGVQLGIVYDPELVAEAAELGEGARFMARFTRAEETATSRPFAHDAQVVRVWDGRFVGTRGTAAHNHVNLGPSCLLRLDGVEVAVVSIRQQILGVEYFEHFGCDTAAARCFVVKSRGHFRAGFEHIVPASRIFEVDAPGLATPNLATVAWRGLARPNFPLDPETTWP